MALTKVGRGLLNTSIVDNGNATAITIDSSENVSFTGAATFSGNVDVDGVFSVTDAGSAFVTRADGGGFSYTQGLDVATAGCTFTGASSRGDMASISLYQTATGVDGGYIKFNTSSSGSTTPTEKMRLDASGKLILSNGNIQGSGGVKFSSDTNFAATKAYTFRDGVGIDNPNASSFSTATASIICVGSMSSSRSINATGTINASGADYAEYENNGGLAIAKGDIVGFKADGKLTLTFNEAIRFAVKSTDPSYVGGDTWADEEPPTKNTVEWDEWSASEPEKETTEWGDWSSDEPTQVSVEWNSWYERIEAKRALVDRIAYSGKVPVNIQGATAGDYIIAVAADDGSIDGQAVSDPDFSQYKLSVGRVNRILEDGRAEVAVIIH